MVLVLLLAAAAAVVVGVVPGLVGARMPVDVGDTGACEVVGEGDSFTVDAGGVEAALPEEESLPVVTTGFSMAGGVGYFEAGADSTVVVPGLEAFVGVVLDAGIDGDVVAGTSGFVLPTGSELVVAGG